MMCRCCWRLVIHTLPKWFKMWPHRKICLAAWRDGKNILARRQKYRGKYKNTEQVKWQRNTKNARYQKLKEALNAHHLHKYHAHQTHHTHYLHHSLHEHHPHHPHQTWLTCVVARKSEADVCKICMNTKKNIMFLKNILTKAYTKAYTKANTKIIKKKRKNIYI